MKCLCVAVCRFLGEMVWRPSLSHCGCSSESFSPWVTFHDHGLFMFLTLCVFFMFVCFSSDVNDDFIQHPFSESLVTRSFLVHPSETSCLCRTWNWQVQVLRGVIAIRYVYQCQPTSVLWLQRNSSDCVWTMSWADRAVIRYIYMVFREYLSNSWYSHGFQWVFELCVVGATFVKLKIVCSCVFELCVGSTRFRVEAVDVHNTQVLAMEVVLAKVLTRSYVSISYFRFVLLIRLACLLVSVLRHWRSVMSSSRTLCRRVTWGDHLWFILVRCLLAMRVASVTERSPIAKISSHILVVLQIFFFELIMFLARCRFFVFVRLIPCVKGQFIQHFLWRATWQDHHRFISLRRHLSVRVLSATECLPVVVRVCSIKCCDGGAVSWN